MYLGVRKGQIHTVTLLVRKPCKLVVGGSGCWVGKGPRACKGGRGSTWVPRAERFSSSLVWSLIIKTNPWFSWVPTQLGCVQKQSGSLFLYMRYITLSCGPVLWSKSELFTLMPSLPTTNCVHSLIIPPLPQLPTMSWL